jgi:hypothetical protein
MALLRSLLIVAVAVVVVWFVASMFGVYISLLWTLAFSVGLTLIVSLASRPRRVRRW